MELPLQITTSNVALTPPEEELIRKAATKLDQFAERILSCRVAIEIPKGRGHAGRKYQVHLKLEVPGEELVVRRKSDEELTTAVQKAFKAMGRTLQDYVRRREAERPSHRPSRAVVTRLFPWEGYGFLTSDEGREVYFHRRSVLNDAFERLEEGMEVRYVEEAGEKGPQASTVAVGRVAKLRE